MGAWFTTLLFSLGKWFMQWAAERAIEGVRKHQEKVTQDALEGKRDERNLNALKEAKTLAEEIRASENLINRNN